MLSIILQQVENVFPSSANKISEEVLNENLPWFCEQMFLLGDDLFKIVETNLSKRPLYESEEELLTWKNPTVSICELRLRPKSVYYPRFNQPIPLPENPNGYHAAGVEIKFSLCRGYFSNGYLQREPYLSIEFLIWGNRERLAFLELLKDHRRQIEKLVSGKDFEFYTSRPFENVDKYRGKDAFKKLELYAQNAEDDENCFSLSKDITENSGLNDVLSALFPLMILYDATLGYCLNKKVDKDRIFQYLKPCSA